MRKIGINISLIFFQFFQLGFEIFYPSLLVCFSFLGFGCGTSLLTGDKLITEWLEDWQVFNSYKNYGTNISKYCKCQ